MASVLQFLTAIDVFESPIPELKEEIKRDKTSINPACLELQKLLQTDPVLLKSINKVIEQIAQSPETADPSVLKLLDEKSELARAIEQVALAVKESKEMSKPSPISVTGSKLATAPVTTTKPANRFANWRSDEKPEFMKNEINVPLEEIKCPVDMQKEVEARCFQQYKKSMALLEHSVGEVSMQYVSRNPFSKGTAPFEDKVREHKANKGTSGVLMNYANAYCQRYMDLYDAYIQMEIDNKIPMLPVTAGQMKLHGFTSPQILKMQDSCKEFTQISDDIKALLGNDDALYNKLMPAITNKRQREELLKDANKRDELLSSLGLKYKQKAVVNLKLLPLIEQYDKLPEKDMIDKAHFLMHDFGHLEYTDIAMQLYYVGIMKPDYDATKEERVQMEIRHRVGGDSSIHQNSPGTLGGNALAYLNMLKKGEPGNPEAEFREKMYFVYMNNHFANAVIYDEKTISSINKYLATNDKGWKLDKEFIEQMNARGPSYIPPIFRYGSNAGINRQLRDMATHEQVAEFYQKNPNISVQEAMEGTAGINAYYNSKLSERELMNQIGEKTWDKDDVNRPWEQLNFGTGAAIFKLFDKVTHDMGESAKEYIEIVNELGLPVFAGISGTLDQSTAMAGLVGLGVDDDPEKRRLELETIKMAYLAFMLPGRDHSAHEILQSSRSYGLDYVAGPGYEEYIYPDDMPHMLRTLNERQEIRGTNMPSYYLSEEYAKQVMEEVKAERALAATQTVDSPTITDSPAKSEQDNKTFYYIGVPISGTKLEEKINSLKPDNAEDLTWVKSNDLHMTIGWMKEDLTPSEREKINKALMPILAKYEDLILNIDKVHCHWSSKDIVINLDEVSGQLTPMREEIKHTLSGMGIPFEWSDHPHIKIADGQKQYRDEELAQLFKPLEHGKEELKGFQVGEANMLHYDMDKWALARDARYPFKAQAKEDELALHEFDKDLAEREDKKAAAREIFEQEKIKATKTVDSKYTDRRRMLFSNPQDLKSEESKPKSSQAASVENKTDATVDTKSDSKNRNRKKTNL